MAPERTSAARNVLRLSAPKLFSALLLPMLDVSVEMLPWAKAEGVVPQRARDTAIASGEFPDTPSTGGRPDDDISLVPRSWFRRSLIFYSRRQLDERRTAFHLPSVWMA
jgi:hypothetical protein